MFTYTEGGRYSQANYELALTDAEWTRLQRAKRSITVYGLDGTRYVIRHMNEKERRESHAIEAEWTAPCRPVGVV
jgi:hypothetical protein